ncbi:unnamed protein product [Amoebophrya sp. A120]|nr:unnamed protein product [Amoebophrya sp. A120]|eukprot:GSA120T00023523001.1
MTTASRTAAADRSLAQNLKANMTVPPAFPFTKEVLIDFLSTTSTAVETLKLAEEQKWDHNSVVGAVKSLQATGAITAEAKQHSGWRCTEEGERCVAQGSPEIRVVADVKKHPSTTQDEITSRLGKDVVAVGFGQAMKNKWIEQNNQQPKKELAPGEKKEKGPPPTFVVTAKGEAPVDETAQLLSQVQSGALTDEKTLQALKKRKLIAMQSLTGYLITKDAAFDSKARAQKGIAELTEAQIASGEWKTANYKPLNFQAQGAQLPAGQLHPLLKVREHYRRTFFQMGFQEMKTNRFVESSFWNFDTLFQPQQHPARDAHDTFFCESPEAANEHLIPKDYLEDVKTMHEKGGHGSIGWRYTWSKEEALTTILRTHTTACTSRVLYDHAQKCKRNGKWKPLKCFSVDRVFRNETLDATHLAEFHQAEGFVADKNLTLGHLIGLFKEFFSHINIKNLKFKPAYNPYTEPSMEIFGYHPGLKKTIEIGNSGVFRPEMLRPMGLPEDVRVIAWGLSLERPTMILYGIKNIRDLVGEKIDVNTLRQNPVCWFPEPEEAEDGNNKSTTPNGTTEQNNRV